MPEYALYREKTREDFIDLVIASDEKLDDKLDELVADLNDIVRRNSTSAGVKDKDALEGQSALALSGFYVVYRSLLKDSNKSSAIISANDELRNVEDHYGDVRQLAVLLSAFGREAEKYPEDVFKNILQRTWGDGVTTEQRIKTIEKESINVVRNIVEVSIRDGASALQLAERIQDYVKPAEDGRRISPFTWYRERFGAKVKKLERGEVPAGSVNYNAFRIARTEINRTYREAVGELQDGKIWVEGFDWNLSGAHPMKDICDDWAKASPYRHFSDLPKGHPNCLCYVTTRLLPVEKVLQLQKKTIKK